MLHTVRLWAPPVSHWGHFMVACAIISDVKLDYLVKVVVLDDLAVVKVSLKNSLYLYFYFTYKPNVLEIKLSHIKKTLKDPERLELWPRVIVNFNRSPNKVQDLAF